MDALEEEVLEEAEKAVVLNSFIWTLSLPVELAAILDAKRALAHTSITRNKGIWGLAWRAKDEIAILLVGLGAAFRVAN